MKKALSIILAAVLVCTFAIPVFAGDGCIIDNSLFCLCVPIYFYGDEENIGVESYYYNASDNISLDILVSENTLDTVAATDESKKLNSDIMYYINEQYDGIKPVLSIEKSKINGLTAVVGIGKYIYEDAEEPFTTYNAIYLFSTKENVILLWFEKDYTDFSAEDTFEIEKCIGTFIMNGTYTGGDALTVEHDFSSAEPFDLDKFYYGDNDFDGNEDNDDFITDVGDFAIALGVLRVVLIILSLPTVALIIAAIVLAVKYSKKKKQLKEYKHLYGEVPPNMNYYGNQGGFNPQYSAPQGYNPQYNQQPYNQQNFYGAPQGFNAPQQPQNPQEFNQQYGSAPAGQPQFNQPAQSAQQEPPKQNYVSIFSADEQNENKDENNTEN